MKNHALKRFRRPPEPLNCAQSVLYAYQKVSGNMGIPLADMKRFGGGRAPGGLCGALHAACSVVPEKAEQLKSAFAAVTGSTCCREIRGANEHPCEVCVSTSADLLEKEMSK
jgi:hypothetical protein